MKEQEKKDYLEKYDQEKKKGLPFFPDIVFKDTVISLIIFLVLVALAYFIGAPLEERADPADTSYTPRPEWYFLFLFQLLKYFPGELEVIGVFVIPTVVILLLFLLPLLDKSPRRYPLKRPVVVGITSIMMVGIVFLSIQSYLETPPPSETIGGDPIATLYTQNCAPCHGPTITVPLDINLHDVIAQGRHETMPAWSGDLTTDEIDALVGFILSPAGSTLFGENCGVCHQVSELIASDPLELNKSLNQGSSYAPHIDLEMPEWIELLNNQERTALLNFLIAPDGQRLYTVNCAQCHGTSVPFSGDEEYLRATIVEGGLHLEMPSWRELLSENELDTLAKYVVDTESVPEGKELYQNYCTACHGGRLPWATDIGETQQIIAGGGAHQTMPVWGEVLTEEQINALVSYSIESARGTPTELGRQLYTDNCAVCHGDFGEGGISPVRADDIIAPISSAEYLKTRDNFTLRNIIAQGQPNFGMSPFGSSYGGPLEDEEVDAIVVYMRTWEQNPPVEGPPEILINPVSLKGSEIYTQICSQCHGLEGEGILGPSLNDPNYQDNNSDQVIFDSINIGHEASPMIGWGEILSSDQIQQLVIYIRSLRQEPVEIQEETTDELPTPTEVVPTFTVDILPIFEVKCNFCHGTLGGWDGTNYEATMTSGDHGPVVIPGDLENSLLLHKLLGTHTEGAIMPPGGKLPDEEIQIIIDWIEAGALE
jgi:mono/diheme cytochrome c family protein